MKLARNGKISLLALAMAAVIATAVAAVPGFFSAVDSTAGYTVNGAAGSGGQALCSDGSHFNTPCNVVSTAYYQTVEANATAQTQRPTLNLISGNNISVGCADNSGSSRTDCTIATATPTQKDCLTTSCAGGSTYVSGTTYTNSTSNVLTEMISMSAPGPGSTGCDYELSSFVGGMVGPYASITNDSFGYQSITIRVIPGATFSATAVQTAGGGGCGTFPGIVVWIEVAG